VAVLLPFAAFSVVRAVASGPAAAPGWAFAAVTVLAAAAAGVALLVAVAASLEDGGVREIADAAGLGMLGTALAVTALGEAGMVGLGLGMLSAAALFFAGSVTSELVMPRRLRGAAIVVAFILVETMLGAMLLSPGFGISDRSAPILVASGAVVMGMAALASLTALTRATGVGIAASSALVMAVAPTGADHLVGPIGIALGAAVLGAGMAMDHLRPMVDAAPAGVGEPGGAATVGKADAEAVTGPEDEDDERARLGRELRATLDDLVAARHLIRLQRDEVDRATNTDQLTGLADRGPTLDRLRTEASEARRYAHPLAVVLVDVDGFSAINHEHGLDVGDRILRDLALRLRVRCREADAVGRIGADAFLAILPHTDEGGAAAFAKAVLTHVLTRHVTTDRGEATVSLSIGIALMRPGMAFSGDELLAAAEEALASARAAGGNRIAFDRLHGLARLEETLRRTASPNEDATGEAAER
jgi:diguanylate cyclase (GGDEF)-like protein